MHWALQIRWHLLTVAFESFQCINSPGKGDGIILSPNEEIEAQGIDEGCPDGPHAEREGQS
jgi:hypothetical protein